MATITEDYVSFEGFVPIKGYEGYLINKEGKVYSSKTKKFLGIRDRNGYLAFTVCVNSKRKDIALHRALAITFIPNPENLPFINHKDGNKHNNVVCFNPDGSIDNERTNLEWCTGSQNVQHAYDTGLAHGHHLDYTPELRHKLGNAWRGKKRSEEDKEKRRKAMLGRKYDATVGQKHKDYCNTKSKEYWSEYFKNIKRKTKKVKSLITGVTYNSVKEAREMENVTIATMTRKLKKGEDYIYVN